MRQISGTLLAVLITLLLGLSPLQGAIAGVSDSFDRQGDTRQITGTFDNVFTVFSDYSVTKIVGSVILTMAASAKVAQQSALPVR
jgi:hypothetical protein